ncbi:unnamed protein product [Moneuplotes crassus]|uniref:Uncharacterized protein n=1 Tax=Euplotes crassus TaxID=5936 RepID=A0AAD2DAK2_EUPCR|nr:unnamed protein product [Moneuplotes crassus]
MTVPLKGKHWDEITIIILELLNHDLRIFLRSCVLHSKRMTTRIQKRMHILVTRKESRHFISQQLAQGALLQLRAIIQKLRITNCVLLRIQDVRKLIQRRSQQSLVMYMLKRFSNMSPIQMISILRILNKRISTKKKIEKGALNNLADSESGNTLTYSKVFGTNSREYVKIGRVNSQDNSLIQDQNIELKKQENFDRIMDFNHEEGKFTSYNSPELHNDNNCSNYSSRVDDEETMKNNYLDSPCASEEISCNTTKKNIFVQENILVEEGAASLEAVREFEEETESEEGNKRERE